MNHQPSDPLTPRQRLAVIGIALVALLCTVAVIDGLAR